MGNFRRAGQLTNSTPIGRTPDRVGSRNRIQRTLVSTDVATLLLWLLLLIVCWPLALLALVVYPIVWLLLLPFRLLGIVVDGVFEFLRAVILLPAKALGR